MPTQRQPMSVSPSRLIPHPAVVAEEVEVAEGAEAAVAEAAEADPP